MATCFRLDISGRFVIPLLMFRATATLIRCAGRPSTTAQQIIHWLPPAFRHLLDLIGGLIISKDVSPGNVLPQAIHVLLSLRAAKKSEAWAGIKHAPMPLCVCMHGMSLTISRTSRATLAFPGWEQRNVSKDVVARRPPQNTSYSDTPPQKVVFFRPLYSSQMSCLGLWQV